MTWFDQFKREDLEKCEKEELIDLFLKARQIADNLVQEKVDFIESSYDGFWDWYIQDNFEYMSPRFWEILGVDYRTKQHDPAEWQDLIFKEDLEIALENLRKHCETRGKHPYRQEVRYRHADGSTVTVLCRGRVIEWGEDGEALRMIGTHKFRINI